MQLLDHRLGEEEVEVAGYTCLKSLLQVPRSIRRDLCECRHFLLRAASALMPAGAPAGAFGAGGRRAGGADLCIGELSPAFRPEWDPFVTFCAPKGV